MVPSAEGLEMERIMGKVGRDPPAPQWLPISANSVEETGGKSDIFIRYI